MVVQAVSPANTLFKGFCHRLPGCIAASGKGRLKADCSQDWLPHELVGLARIQE